MLVVLGLVIPFWFKAAKAHDELIKFQYENDYDAWKKSGEPSGLQGYRAPTQSRNLLRGFFVSNPAITMLMWSFFTPSWVNKFPEAQDILRKLRRNVLAWNLGISAFAIYCFLVLALFAYGFATGFLE